MDMVEFIYSRQERELLCDLIDLHLGQLEDAAEATTADRTITKVDDLLSVQGQYQDEKTLLERTKHLLRGCCRGEQAHG
jgi:hypothetical protein